MLSTISFELLFIISSLLFGIILISNFLILLFILRKLVRKFLNNKEVRISQQKSIDSQDSRNYQETGFIKRFKFFLRKYILKILFIFGYSTIVLVIGILICEMFFSFPEMVSSYPEYGSYWNDYERPISVIYNRPINTHRLVLNISPETEGYWEYKKVFGFLPLVREVRFIPEETIYPGNEVLVYLADVSNVSGLVSNKEDHISFHSVELPKVVSSEPENNAIDIKPSQDIVFNLSHKEGSFVDWEFEIEPEDTTFQIQRDNTQQVRIFFDSDLKQGIDYNLKVFQIPFAKDTKTGEVTKKGERNNIYNLSFRTVSAVLVESMSPQGGGILTNSQIKIVFKQDVNKKSVESLFSINPQVEGELKWQNDRTFIFVPNSLEKAKKYTVKISKGVTSFVGGVSEHDVMYSFDTVGQVKVANVSPAGGSSSAGVSTNIKVTFNQLVDHASAESKFYIDPPVAGKFIWSGNTISFDPDSEFEYLKTYNFGFQKGIRSVHGLDSESDFSYSFTTEPKKVVLDVALYKQTSSRSCNLVAARMVMAYKGIHKSTDQIFAEIPKDNTPCDAENNTWGNPNVGFVGDINGNHDCASGKRGYGVYWGPVSRYLSSNGISNKIISGGTLSGLAKELEAGHPIILWWQNGWSTAENISWTTPDGQSIYAINGMHSEVVVGFIGTSDNPTHFIMNDPWRGRRTLDASYVYSQWGYFGRTGIVVL